MAPRSDSIYIDYLRNIRVKNIVVENGRESTLKVGTNRRIYLGDGNEVEIYFNGENSIFNHKGINIEFKRDGSTVCRICWDKVIDSIYGIRESNGTYGKGVALPIKNLAGTTGKWDGQIMLDDGSNTSHRGMPCVWDDVNSVWVRVEDGVTFT